MTAEKKLTLEQIKVLETVKVYNKRLKRWKPLRWLIPKLYRKWWNGSANKLIWLANAILDESSSATSPN